MVVHAPGGGEQRVYEARELKHVMASEGAGGRGGPNKSDPVGILGVGGVSGDGPFEAAEVVLHEPVIGGDECGVSGEYSGDA